PGAVALAGAARARGIRVRSYGRASDDVRLLGHKPVDGGGVASISLQGKEIDVTVAVPGEHMAGNALAALIAGLELGAPLDGLLDGLAAFGGVRRRFEFKGRADDVRVYDDYAHHPTEVDAQLRAARPTAGNGKLVVVFQP